MNINTTQRQGTGKQIRLIMITGLMMALTACSSDLDKLRELCEKDAGLTIYKTVEADGYYDATRKGGALWVLIPSKYDFTEFCNFDTNQPSFNEAGCWRLTKVSRKTNQCNQTINKALANSGSDSSREFREKNCIAVEKIAKPTARYKYEVKSKVWWVNESAKTRITQYVGRIVNNKTGIILGEGKNFVLRPKHSTPPSFNCGSPQITGLQKSRPFAAGLIEKTIHPKSWNKKGDLK